MSRIGVLVPGGGFLRVAVALAAVILTATTLLLVSVSGPVYVVASDSMAPTLEPGDMLWLRPVSGSIVPAMVVSYRLDDRVVTHRVVSVEDGHLRTKGDNNSGIDTWDVPRSDVVGTPFLRIPRLGIVLGYVRRPIVWVLLVLIPACVIVTGEIWKIWHTLHTPDRSGRKE